MFFGVYLHTQGPGGLLRQAVLDWNASVKTFFDSLVLDEMDGLVMSLMPTSRIEHGFKVRKRKVRRDYKLRLIAGGVEHYRCLVEVDVNIADADVIELSSLSSGMKYLKSLVLELVPHAFKGLGDKEKIQFEKLIINLEN